MVQPLAKHGARKELHDRERRLRTLIDATPDAVMVLREDSTLEEANPAARRMLGVQDDATAIASPFDAFVAEQDVAKFRDLHTAVCRGEGGRCEIRLRSMYDEVIVIDLVSAPLEIETGKARHLAIARDVTTNRKLEEQLRRTQRMDAVGKLTGGIAHDFNNLLTVVLGNSELLAESLADHPDLRALAETSRSAAERGAVLTERLLAFSRQQTLAPRAVDVGQQLRGMGSLLKRSLGEDIDIRVTGSEQPAIAEVDPHQFENAVLNLCINARDAMPDGGRLALDVSIREIGNIDREVDARPGADDEPESARPGRYVVLTATDTGTGMSEDVASRAFEPFFTTSERLRPGLPVVLTSGYAANLVFPDGRVPSGMRLLNKPYRRAELARLLREVLNETTKR